MKKLIVIAVLVSLTGCDKGNASKMVTEMCGKKASDITMTATLGMWNESVSISCTIPVKENKNDT